MPEYAENVVVGSGFGGSVVAHRLAAAGMEVRLLERGKRYPPGSFPRQPWEMAANFWDPSAGHLGLFDYWSFRGLDAVVSAGLGGGSLIYANVLIRKPPEWFVRDDRVGADVEDWPVSYEDLEPHYEAVERMLRPELFPVGRPGFEQVKKAQIMLDAGSELVPLGIRFTRSRSAKPAVGVPLAPEDYGNLHLKLGAGKGTKGTGRVSCMLCGQCDIGCNSGSKNTLDHTFLSAAHHSGARIDERTEVRRIAAVDSGYDVEYVVHPEEHDDGRERRTQDPRVLEPRHLLCKRLFLAAGSLGTTFLLLASRRELPGLSLEALGSRFSSNGDVLMIMKDARSATGRPLALNASSGPVITTALRVPDAVEDGGKGGRGHYIEDAGYPLILDWLVELRPTALPQRLLVFAAKRLWAHALRNPRTELGRDLAQLVGSGAWPSSAMPLLGMGRDVPDGRMSLENDRYLAVDWTTKTSQGYFDEVRESMSAVAGRLNGQLVRYDLLSFLRRSISVHPLGGAPMATAPASGVCDRFGEVYGHRNLFVVDGALLPGPVGANPSLTIAAMSDWVSTAVLEGRTGARR